jgi:NAD(P)-dependent dehydrogenase (short-subunit alcohol dehydrogenase family)
VLTVVTGGSRGIGAAVAVRLAREGHDLVLAYKADETAALEVARAVRALGRNATAVQADVTDDEAVAALMRRARELGPVTGLVNNAASASAVGRLEDNPMSAVRADVEVNLLAVLACVKAAIPAMRDAGGGAVVNISSAAATLGSPGMYVHYAAAKAAVDALTVGLAKELAEDRIRVNAVAPGIVRTGFHRDPERPAKLAPTIPIGRPGEPEEIAGAVAWLLSADASYTTGTVLRVAGGM